MISFTSLFIKFAGDLSELNTTFFIKFVGAVLFYSGFKWHFLPDDLSNDVAETPSTSAGNEVDRSKITDNDSVTVSDSKTPLDGTGTLCFKQVT